MANELFGSFQKGTSGNYFVVVNPDNHAQAWDTNAGAWASKDITDANQQIAASGEISEGTMYGTFFADLPAGLEADVEYPYYLYNSSEQMTGFKYLSISNSIVEDTEALPSLITSALEAATQFGPVSQEDVPANLITTMVNYEGQVLSSSENKLELVVGDSYGTGLADEAVLCAVDWTKTLGNVKRLSSFVALTLISGTEGGVTTEIIGIDHTLSKFTATPVTAGTYVYLARVKVAGSNSYRAGYVTIQVIDPAATYGT